MGDDLSQHDASRTDLKQTERTTVRRLAERGRHDRASVNGILDEAYIAHVGFVVDGAPKVLPMAFGRIDDVLYLHGAVGNAMLRASADAEVCVTVTLLDGLVLARSAFHHSMNYRCVVLFGTATRVDDETEQRLALEAVVDHTLAGRTADARGVTPAEQRKTLVLRLPIDEGSAKIRTGQPVDDDADQDLAVWAGIVPLRLVSGEPQQDPAQSVPGLSPPPPESLRR